MRITINKQTYFTRIQNCSLFYSIAKYKNRFLFYVKNILFYKLNFDIIFFEPSYSIFVMYLESSYSEEMQYILGFYS